MRQEPSVEAAIIASNKTSFSYSCTKLNYDFKCSNCLVTMMRHFCTIQIQIQLIAKRPSHKMCYIIR